MEKRELLKKVFGYDSFREGQEAIIDNILMKRDVLAVMPTGAGKSICYQIPALLETGITVVISPLISLMIDQVKSLNQAGIHAAYINSTLSESQINKALELAKQGKYKIIYVAPERLENATFTEFASSGTISILAIDEAHCISQWGQDFRPSYLKILQFIKLLPRRPVICAFTATATERVKEDIKCILNLENPFLTCTGFDRPNLFFKVQPIQQKKVKDMEIISYIREHTGECGIIYCATRKNVDELCEWLQRNNLPATKYHAGLNNNERARNQEDFIYDRAPIMVATNAFGMGIDKSNVRYVLHYNMPQSIENYYQEAGRAGRDGEKAECILYYSTQDIMINRFLIESKSERGEQSDYDDRLDATSLQKEHDEERLKYMTFYCTTKECLREYMLNYFGEYSNKRCENCGNCQGEFEEVDVTQSCKDMINCIWETKQRFGFLLIFDILLGKETAKVRSYGFQNLKTFGMQKEKDKNYLRRVLDEMLLQNYLTMTKDKFSIVQMNPSIRDFKEGKQILLKFSKQESTNKKAESSNSSKRKSNILTGKGMELFEALRAVRTEIAREEAVPPYIIFSDKTLLDMCRKVPFHESEMLNVEGVGTNKLEKYGERFLQVIFQFCNGKKQTFCYEEYTEEIVMPKTKQKKSEFQLTEQMRENYEILSNPTLTEIVAQLNQLRDKTKMKVINVSTIAGKLDEEEYIINQKSGDLYIRKALPKGLEVGIYEEEKINQTGVVYTVLHYNEVAQLFLLERLWYWQEIGKL